MFSPKGEVPSSEAPLQPQSVPSSGPKCGTVTIYWEITWGGKHNGKGFNKSDRVPWPLWE